jgi:beta-xylosidase
MYYSGEDKSSIGHHCVGTAVADKPTGPYVPSKMPLLCRLDQGGSIDPAGPAGFKDKDGSQYVVFKVDGNTIGHGGICNNGIEPLIPTPILLQKVAKDGVTPIGDAVQILDRNTADNDGPLVEAPNLTLQGDTYFLFYSTHCFFDPKYGVRWATASSITGPYNKTNDSMVKAHKTGLISPGGATVCGSGDRILFHGFCTEAKTSRCMYVADVTLSGKTASVA